MVSVHCLTRSKLAVLWEQTYRQQQNPLSDHHSLELSLISGLFSLIGLKTYQMVELENSKHEFFTKKGDHEPK